MAIHCRSCARGDHADCTRWLMRDHPCSCVCDDAPRQLTLPWGSEEEPAAPAVGHRRPAALPADGEVPW